MSAFENHINQLVKGEEPEFDFPKNESSWEELFDFGVKRIGEIVVLKRKAAEQSVHLTALRRWLAYVISLYIVLVLVVTYTRRAKVGRKNVSSKSKKVAKPARG